MLEKGFWAGGGEREKVGGRGGQLATYVPPLVSSRQTRSGSRQSRPTQRRNPWRLGGNNVPGEMAREIWGSNKESARGQQRRRAHAEKEQKKGSSQLTNNEKESRQTRLGGFRLPCNGLGTKDGAGKRTDTDRARWPSGQVVEHRGLLWQATKCDQM